VLRSKCRSSGCSGAKRGRAPLAPPGGSRLGRRFLRCPTNPAQRVRTPGERGAVLEVGGSPAVATRAEASSMVCSSGWIPSPLAAATTAVMAADARRECHGWMSGLPAVGARRGYPLAFWLARPADVTVHMCALGLWWFLPRCQVTGVSREASVVNHSPARRAHSNLGAVHGGSVESTRVLRHPRSVGLIPSLHRGAQRLRAHESDGTKELHCCCRQPLAGLRCFT